MAVWRDLCSSLWLFEDVDQPLYPFLQTYDFEDKQFGQNALDRRSDELFTYLLRFEPNMLVYSRGDH